MNLQSWSLMQAKLHEHDVSPRGCFIWQSLEKETELEQEERVNSSSRIVYSVTLKSLTRIVNQEKIVI